MITSNPSSLSGSFVTLLDFSKMFLSGSAETLLLANSIFTLSANLVSNRLTWVLPLLDSSMILAN